MSQKGYSTMSQKGYSTMSQKGSPTMSQKGSLTDDFSQYRSPLVTKYASNEMIYNFSEKQKVIIWRRLWFWLAKAKQELGYKITDQQLEEMEANVENIDFEEASKEENRIQHGISAHLHIFANVCPKAAPMMHLGAASAFAGDNADLIVIRDGLDIIIPKLAKCIYVLSRFAHKHRELVCLSYTHLQPSQPSTMGKRACIWIQDLLMDLHNIERSRKELRFRGVKGSTGTQATILALFDHDKEKVFALDRRVTELAGFDNHYTICGQTYSRKVDVDYMAALASFGASVHKICTDIRLLASFKEMEELHDKNQMDSADMVYKRNPQRSERCCSLSRHMICLVQNSLMTASVSWLERSLDDSANRRISIAEAFLAADSVLITMETIFGGLVVYPQVIQKRLHQELPFIATEHIVLEMVKLGAHRQKCHEEMRTLAQEAAAVVKLQGHDNDLMKRISSSEYFAPVHERLSKLMDPAQFVGLAPEQVDLFLANEVKPALHRYAKWLPEEPIDDH